MNESGWINAPALGGKLLASKCGGVRTLYMLDPHSGYVESAVIEVLSDGWGWITTHQYRREPKRWEERVATLPHDPSATEEEQQEFSRGYVEGVAREIRRQITQSQ